MATSLGFAAAFGGLADGKATVVGAVLELFWVGGRGAQSARLAAMLAGGRVERFFPGKAVAFGERVGGLEGISDKAFLFWGGGPLRRCAGEGRLLCAGEGRLHAWEGRLYVKLRSR
jgi:hypothetical protein